MKIIHISDMHLLPPGEPLFSLEPYGRLRACLGHIIRRHADADLCLFTGDLAHGGGQKAYLALADLLAGFPLPHGLLLGNHDERETFLEVFGRSHPPEQGFVQSVLDLKGVRLICLDTKADEPGAHGRLCPARLDWLAQRLGEEKRPVILAMHHPFFPLGIPSMDSIGLRDGDDLIALLLKNRQRIRRLVFGHHHRFISGTWQGIPFHTMNSTAHQLALNATEPERVSGNRERPAYGAILWERDREIVMQCHFLDCEDTFWVDD